MDFNRNVRKMTRYMAWFSVELWLGTFPACGAETLFDFSKGLPRTWEAKGSLFGTDDKTENLCSDLTHYYAVARPTPGLVVSPEFRLANPYLNIQIDGDRLSGQLSLIRVSKTDGRRQVIRKSLAPALQIPGWLKDGWFSFDVGEYSGETVYFQLAGCRSLSSIALKQILAEDKPRGDFSGQAYIEAIGRMLDKDRDMAGSDPFRPVLHAIAPSGKSWDANGLVFKDGVYHFFYLVRPNGAGPVQGHKVSKDLVSWEERPVAAWPNIEEGEEAVWSGSAVIDDEGRCHIFYTGVGPDRSSRFAPRQGHLVSIDEKFDRFRKVDTSMITLDDFPVPAHAVRDPFAFRNGGTWYLTLTGSVLKEGQETVADQMAAWPKESCQGALFLFESQNLNDWKYKGIALRSEKKPLWEVSDLFRSGGRWFFSPGGKEYHVGDFDLEKGTFTDTREPGKACLGLFYAYRSMAAPDGRRLVISRVKEGGGLAVKKWEGAYTFPREWWLEDDVLRQRPAKELEVLRKGHAEFSGSVKEGIHPVMTASTEYELIAELDMGTAETCGLEIRRSKEGSQAYRISWDGRKATARVVSPEPAASKPVWWKTPVGIVPEKKTNPRRIKFHLFVDRGLVELFVDDQKTFERPVEEIPLDCNGIAVFAEGGQARVVRLDRWNLSK